MAENITKEDFIKWLKDYLVDVEFTKSVESRIRFMLAKVNVEKIVEIVKIKRVEVPVIEYKYVKADNTVIRDGEEVEIPSLEQLAIEVYMETGITLEEMRSPSRKDELVAARKHFIYKTLKYQYGVKEVGRFIHRDHTTVVHHKLKLVPSKRRRRA